ncbi:MAG: hypothetical protein ACREOH_20110 [Candidatus Entotheonellia bacterium]
MSVEGDRPETTAKAPIPPELPLLISESTVIYPYIVLPIAVAEVQARVIEEGLARNRRIPAEGRSGLFDPRQPA